MKRYRNKVIRKLTLEQRDEILRLRKKGWSLLKIAKKFSVDHSTIIYHIRRSQNPEFSSSPNYRDPSRRHIIRESTILAPTPVDINKIEPPMKQYDDYLKEDKEKTEEKLKQCEHPFWIKKCSVCNEILDSDEMERIRSKEVEPNEKT